MRTLLLALAVVTLALIGAAATAKEPAPVDDARLKSAPSDSANWLTYGGSWLEQRYSTLTQINPNNIVRLAPAWSFDLDTDRGQESTPQVGPVEADFIGSPYYSTSPWSKGALSPK